MITCDAPDEAVILDCAGCGVPILTWWDGNGRGLLRGEYDLLGDFVFHPKCSERLLADMDREQKIR